MTQFCLFCAFAFALLGLHPVCAQTYSVTDIGALPGSDNSVALAVNAGGDVTGYSNLGSGIGPEHAFLYHPGTLTDLGVLPPEGRSIGNGLNAFGDIVGSGEPGSPFTHAFLYHAGKMIDLGTLGGRAAHADSINAAGAIVGDWTDPHGHSHAFLDDRGKITDLGALIGTTDSSAQSINDRGEVTGWASDNGNYRRAFLFRQGKAILIGPQYGPPELTGNAINSKGEIAGISRDMDRTSHAFFYDGTQHELATLPGFARSFALALNAKEQIVGYVQDPSGFGQNLHACLWEQGKCIDLNAQIPAGSGWTLREARGINDRGQIIGNGMHRGKERGFFLKPLAAPATQKNRPKSLK